MNPWMAIIGAALGGVRASAEDSKNKRQTRVETTREQWSPWTGQHGKDVKPADYMGTVMQGASSGMAMGQGMGGGGGAAAGGANAGQGATSGMAFNGQGPTMAQQNGAAGSAIDYGSPGASGYSSYPGAGAGQSQAPAYNGPGMDLTGTQPAAPTDGTVPADDGIMLQDPYSPKKKKAMNVSPAGAMNFYAPRR